MSQLLHGTRFSVPRRLLRLGRGKLDLRGEDTMINATEYLAMAAEHHRLAGMCRSPDSREQHLRLEEQFRALAERRETWRESSAPQPACGPQILKSAGI
jgi:hypothetical protein